MKKQAILGIAALLLAPAMSFAGLASYGAIGKAYKAQQAGKYEDCIKHSEKLLQATQKDIDSFEKKIAKSDGKKPRKGDKNYGLALEYASFGHAFLADCRKELGGDQKQIQADYQQCLDLAAKSDAEFELFGGGKGLVFGGKREDWVLQSNINNNRSKATCLKKMGNHKEGIAAMEDQIKFLNDACHTNCKACCKMVADDTETLAKWRKETGIKEEKSAETAKSEEKK